MSFSKNSIRCFLLVLFSLQIVLSARSFSQINKRKATNDPLAQKNIDLPDGFDQYVDSVLKIFEVPGVSIAIVKDRKVVLAKGYGIKKLGEKSAVTPHTLFSIASNTKAFTAAALEILVEEKKIKWDDPVINYLPWFRMSDPWVTSQITISDLLVHHSGIPAYAGDLLIFPPSNYSRQEILGKLKDIPIVHSFRTTYAYDNILYLAAGEVVKAASGMEWEDFIQQKIFDVLGMNESVARFSAMKTHADISAAHSRVQGIVKTDDQYFDQAIGDAGDPCGGIASNAEDMSKWLIAQIDSGMGMKGKRIFASDATKDLWRIVTPIPIATTSEDLAPAQMDFFGYALGVRTYNYGKYKVIGHGGKLDGFVSQVAFIPKLKLGIAVLTNQESSSAYWSIIYSVFDYYMQNKKFDWLSAFKKQKDSSLAQSKREWEKANISPITKTKYSLPLEKYAGVYNDDFYGDVIVEKLGDKLIMKFKQTPQLTAELVPFQYETFIARFQNSTLKADAYTSFSIGPNAVVDEIKMKIIDPDCDISFEGLSLKRKVN